MASDLHLAIAGVAECHPRIAGGFDRSALAKRRTPDVARRFECVQKLSDHAAIVAAFHFLRQPIRPGAARPPTNPKKCVLCDALNIKP